MQQFKDSRNIPEKKFQERLIIAKSNSNIRFRTNNKISKPRKQKLEEKNIYMGTSNDKLRKFPIRGLWVLIRRENLKKEAEFLLIATQYNSMRKNYVKEKPDNT